MARPKKSIASSGISVSNNNYVSKEDMKKVHGIMNEQAMTKSASRISFSSPTYYNPLYTETSFMLPKDRKQTNVWLRHLYQTEALVGSAIDLYADLPITGYSIECGDPIIRKEMEDMCKRIKLRELFQYIALEYFLIGDVFIMSQLDRENKTWKRITVLNPDQIEARIDPLLDFPTIELIPDTQLTTTIMEKKPVEAYNYYVNNLPQVVNAVRNGKNIALNPALVTHMRYKGFAYGAFGNPLMKRIFKTMMYKEMIRRAQFSIAERFVTPLKIFQVGSMQEPGTLEEIENVQSQLDRVIADPNLLLVTNGRLTTQWQGIAGKTLQLGSEYDFIENETLGGLSIARAFIDGGGTNFATASVGGNAFLQKLENFREMLKEFVEEKIFKPILEMNRYYQEDEDTDIDSLIQVNFKWDALKIQDESTLQQALLGLRQQNLISTQTLLNAYHIDAETEAVLITKEQDTIFDSKRMMAMQQAIATETNLALQLQYQKLLQDLLPQPPGSGTQPQTQPEDFSQGMPSMALPQGQKGAPPEKNTDGMTNVPMPGMPGTMDRGLFTPVDGGYTAPPRMTASRADLKAMVKEALLKVQQIQVEEEQNEREDS